MDDNTQQFVKQESKIAGISVRAALAVLLTMTICAIFTMGAVQCVLSDKEIVVGEPLYSMAVAALGFYFGQKNLQQRT